MTWDWSYTFQILPELLKGTLFTLLVALVSSVIALGGGLAIALLNIEIPRWGKRLVRLFVDLMRGVPILVLIYFGYYVLPHIGLTWPAAWIGILVLGVVYAAYASEVYRGGLSSIPDSTYDACHALGLSRVVTLRRVLIPLTVKATLPSLMNYVLMLFKQSSFLFAIGVPVLLGVAQVQGYQSFRYLEPYTVAALLYLLLNLPFVYLLKRLEASNARR